MLGFDIETTGLLSDAQARISVVCTVETQTGSERVYNFMAASCEAGRTQLRNDLVGEMNAAVSLCAYNAVLFDIPFLQRELQISDQEVQCWLLKLFDPFHAMKTTFNVTSKLNAMLALNGLSSKSGSGGDAVEMAKNREWESLTRYCMDDVRLTLALAVKPELILFGDQEFLFCIARFPSLRFCVCLVDSSERALQSDCG